jgi:hypothetical protein
MNIFSHDQDLSILKKRCVNGVVEDVSLVVTSPLRWRGICFSTIAADF